METLSILLEDILVNDKYEIDENMSNINPQILLKFPKLSSKKIYFIIEKITNQMTLNDKIHAIYKYNILNLDLEYVTNITTVMKNVEHFYFDAIDQNIVFNAVNHEELANYISSFNGTFIVLPISFIYNGTKSGHRAQILINKKDNTIHILDPNGYLSYFDKLFDDFTHQYLIDIIKQYFEMVFIFLGCTYTINSKIYPNINRVININRESDKKGYGQCQIVSIFLSFLICFFGIDIEEAHNLIKELNDEEFIFLMANFAHYSINLN